ncbi:hypothetical protein [Saliphagus sp. LR7]|uniref:hypothetical protein n=1 Tax=Saliphagus sp. LR7 TaxID=2282654 RepID=UPI000DF7AAFB|nr:hypothetical protein [Saliphagus sp. LR7]
MTTDETDLRALIGQAVDVRIGSTVVDVVVKDIVDIHERLQWRQELLIATDGTEVQVPPTMLVP